MSLRPRDGEYKEYWPDGKLRYEASYKSDKLEGQVKRWSRHGFLLSLENYHEGYLEGETIKWYYSNPQVIGCHYHFVKNKLHGICKDWYPDGYPAIVSWKFDGESVGLIKRWDANGMCHYGYHYKYGKFYSFSLRQLMSLLSFKNILRNYVRRKLQLKFMRLNIDDLSVVITRYIL